ncbi:MAG: prepilin peptidase, partial [Actinomycetota bacterium]
MTIDSFVLAAAGVLGLIFGSFGTVAAYRIPKRESIVTGRSKCPHCGHTITAVENIPVLSYLLQRGRCRHCRAPISARYPLIEAGTGVLFALAAWKFVVSDYETTTTGDWILAAVYAGFLWVLVVLSMIDFEHKQLYDRIVFPALAASWLGLVIVSAVEGRVGRFSGTALYGVVLALGLLALALPWGGDPEDAAGAEPPPEGQAQAVGRSAREGARERRAMKLLQLLGIA